MIDIRHLAPRFFGSLSSAPPSADDQRWVEAHLLPGELDLWMRQSMQDRRHSALVARRFSERRAGVTRAEIAGALLHDVGKVEGQLGTWARVLATIVGPRGARFRAYHDHVPIGARLAADAGSDADTVDLIAERHPAYDDLRASDHA